MLRATLAVARNTRPFMCILNTLVKSSTISSTLKTAKNFSSHSSISFLNYPKILGRSLINNASILKIATNINQQRRTVTKFSLKKGKRKTVKAVIKRFKRLDWGGWIRTHSGRNKKMWKKSGALKRRLRQHLLVNSSQSWLLDKMVTKFWRRPKHYIDDPYKPYHLRNEYFATRKKPIDY